MSYSGSSSEIMLCDLGRIGESVVVGGGTGAAEGPGLFCPDFVSVRNEGYGCE